VGFNLASSHFRRRGAERRARQRLGAIVDVVAPQVEPAEPASIVDQPGRAVKIDGVWLVSRETVCDAFAVGGYRCPPRT
jgi:hypothetical protein